MYKFYGKNCFAHNTCTFCTALLRVWYKNFYSKRWRQGFSRQYFIALFYAQVTSSVSNIVEKCIFPHKLRYNWHQLLGSPTLQL